VQLFIIYELHIVIYFASLFEKPWFAGYQKKNSSKDSSTIENIPRKWKGTLFKTGQYLAKSQSITNAAFLDGLAHPAFTIYFISEGWI